MAKWAVLLGNENVWTVDGKPETFDTMEDAIDAFNAFMADMEEAVRDGFLESACDPDDYRIEQLQGEDHAED
jgi:hypothetical protein